MRVIHVLSSVRWSGVERYALDICCHYASAGCEVLALTRDARAVDDVFRHHSIPVAFAPLDGFLSYGAVKAMRSIFAASTDHTVVHCHSTKDAFCAMAARRLLNRGDIRIVLTRHFVRHAGRTMFHKYVYRNVDAMIFVSEIVKARFLCGRRLRILYPTDETRLHVLHNSLNITLAPRVPEPERGPVTAMYLGRLSPGKGLEYLLEAMAELQGVKLRLRIVGTGHPDYVDNLRRLADSLGVMHLIDWPRHRDDTADYIRTSHFGVLPSSDPEAFGLSNIEYMAEGRPLICTSNGAQPEYISDGVEGLLVAPGDSVSLAEAMRRLATSKNLREEIGVAARRKFEDVLSWPHFISRLDRIYCSDNSRSASSCRED